MPSLALSKWNTTRARQLDQLARAHLAVGGSKRGRRRETEQLNHAYLVLLAAAFQGFCRDLHSESVTALIKSVNATADLEDTLLVIALNGRQLDARNATRATIGADFNILGLGILDELKLQRPSNRTRLAMLDRMNDWRNAVAHQSFDRKTLDPVRLRLRTVEMWRRQCTILVTDLDRVMNRHLARLVGHAPW